MPGPDRETNAPPARTGVSDRSGRGAFESAIRARFGDVEDDLDGPCLYEVSDSKGVPANWVHFSVSWSRVDDVCPDLVAIAKSQGLAVCDPPRGLRCSDSRTR